MTKKEQKIKQELLDKVKTCLPAKCKCRCCTAIKKLLEEEGYEEKN